MYNSYKAYPCPYYMSTPMYYPPCPCCDNMTAYNQDFSDEFPDRYDPFTDEMDYDRGYDLVRSSMDENIIPLRDYGPEPFVVNIEDATLQNDNFRTALWTGNHLQLTLMSIDVGGEIGLEMHPNTDQFIRIEQGQGVVRMGDSRNNLDFQRNVYEDFIFIIPAGKWHNLINTGNTPIKLYSIYAPPQHPRGTVHVTKADAEAAEEHHNH